MEHMISRQELEVDLESGGTTSEEEVVTKDHHSSAIRKNNSFFSILNFDGSVKGECSTSTTTTCSKFRDGGTDENFELLIDKSSEATGSSEEKKSGDGKNKKKHTRKLSKPPRPPKGPSLDAVDQKFVREMAELAMRKRARVERIKALRKTRATKPSSSSSSISAMVVTVLFCIIIIFQGMCSKSNASMESQGSPAPAVAGSEGLISVQLYDNFVTNERNEPSYSLTSSEKRTPVLRTSGSDSK
ncbi:hypothetical protein ACFE04_016916 [Oxalis oulophora]